MYELSGASDGALSIPGLFVSISFLIKYTNAQQQRPIKDAVIVIFLRMIDPCM